ncbi:MAG TPA: alpha-1,4-glucan--maltose-1-phosphate maltosyltransferase [Steroidobacteraceae bacterium]|nr:alpha-1,4-glucan--maltose-1-phosphate maltosyltransferase [Steroidobacteraceae bacterium]
MNLARAPRTAPRLPDDGEALPADGARRVVIENVTPCIAGGRFAIKRVSGERVQVEADAFTDGHDAVGCALLHRCEQGPWTRVPMLALGNDRWRAQFTAGSPGRCQYTVLAWVDHLASWRRDIAKKQAAGQDLSVDLQRGAALVRACAERAAGEHREHLGEWARTLELADAQAYRASQDPALHELAWHYPDPAQSLELAPPLEVSVERERARFSSWYELFPRSTGRDSGTHGTFADCAAQLPRIAAMGFDVLYLPPIHPIGHSERKGPNNRTGAGPGDPGSPWAIGSEAGGHDAVHPDLGTLDDFRRLQARAGELGIELALDLAFQCSPDHPYVREHPEWFLSRPDGSIQYAENPPKKYQDIYPFHFEGPAWRELWHELAHVVEFWIGAGVRIFRVDNPHTKPFAFWEWLIARVRSAHPEVLFLAEAFTRPKIMHRLAKLGFTQSYTYFAWRNTRDELIAYFRELTSPPVCEFLRPNLWPNTPDILTEYLQFGGRPAFIVRLVLAATLGASYGIYGPAFELTEHEPRDPGSEEYRDSEKYQLRHWDLARPDSLEELIARINRIRREHPALQSDRSLVFHGTDNETLIAYSKTAAEHTDVIIVVANLDPHNPQSGWLDLDLSALGLTGEQTFQVHDLLSGSRFLWRGARNFVRLVPQSAPAHVLLVRRRVRTERDFDYFL